MAVHDQDIPKEAWSGFENSLKMLAEEAQKRFYGLGLAKEYDEGPLLPPHRVIPCGLDYLLSFPPFTLLRGYDPRRRPTEEIWRFFVRSDSIRLGVVEEFMPPGEKREFEF